MASQRSDRIEGWFWPTGARKCHFDGGDGRALCGKWARVSPFGGAAPIEGGPEAAASKCDCVSCRRKLEARSLGAFLS